MQETNGIEGSLQQGLVEQLASGDRVPACAKNSFCSNCSVPLNQANERLVKGTSAVNPIKFWEYCSSCWTTCGYGDRSYPLRKIAAWSSLRLESFESRDVALDTMITVVVQGFASGPAKYQPSELIYLRTFATQSDPRCFWTGLHLSLDSDAEPRTKFSLDRTMFANGKALNYGSEHQIVVAASLFSNR